MKVGCYSGPSSGFDFACRVLLTAAALAGELAVVSMVCQGRVVLAIAFHLAACSCVAMVAAAAAIGCRHRERGLRFGCALLLSISLPVVGSIGVLLVLVPIWLRSVAVTPQALLDLPRPDWADFSRRAAAQAECLIARVLTPPQRVQLLLGQRGMPAVAAVPGLRAALRDANEEVRLLAHALLERRETRVRAEIQAAETELARACRAESTGPDPTRCFQLQRLLAHLHSGLVEADLACGELAHESLSQAKRFAEEALARDECGDLCMLLARVCLREDDGLAAWHWLQRAEKAAVAWEDRAPLYAEAAFLLQRFEQIPHWLRDTDLEERQRKLAPFAANWSS